MKTEQIKAANSLRRALNKCAKAGLSGGVFDTVFCVWPSEKDPETARLSGEYSNFFDAVDGLGLRLSTEMSLDGGAGN